MRSSLSYGKFENHIGRKTCVITPYKCHSRMTFFGGKLSTDFVDAYLIFHLKLRVSHLNSRSYSEYQHFLYKKITKLREIGWSFNKIAQWLNSKGYSTVRGKMFLGSHVHSIIKKKMKRDIKLSKKYKSKICDFSLRFIDKTVINTIR